MRTSLGKFGKRLRDRLLTSLFVTGVDYVQAVRRRRELCAEVALAMADVDVLLTAAQPAEAAKIDAVPHWDNMEKPNFTMPFNVSGLPAISICSGFGVRGTSGRDPDRGQALRRSDGVPRGASLRGGDAMAFAPPEPGRRGGEAGRQLVGPLRPTTLPRAGGLKPTLHLQGFRASLRVSAAHRALCKSRASRCPFPWLRSFRT